MQGVDAAARVGSIECGLQRASGIDMSTVARVWGGVEGSGVMDVMDARWWRRGIGGCLRLLLPVAGFSRWWLIVGGYLWLRRVAAAKNRISSDKRIRLGIR